MQDESMGVTHEEIQEAIAAYAINSPASDDMPATEKDLLEHIAGCEECGVLFRDLREVAGDLALIAPPIPVSAELEQRILSGVRFQQQERAPSRRKAPRGHRSLVAASVIAIALGALSASLYVRGNDGQTRSQQIAAILADPTAERAAICNTRPKRQCTVAVTRDGAGALVASKLPAIPANSYYELWLVKDGTPLAIKIFRPSDGPTEFLFNVTRGDYDAAAITIERRMEQRPTGEMVFSGSLKA